MATRLVDTIVGRGVIHYVSFIRGWFTSRQGVACQVSDGWRTTQVEIDGSVIVSQVSAGNGHIIRAVRQRGDVRNGGGSGRDAIDCEVRLIHTIQSFTKCGQENQRVRVGRTALLVFSM